MCGLKEEGFWERRCYDVLHISHVKRAALEAMNHHKEVESTICWLSLILDVFTNATFWVNFCCKLLVLL